MVKSYYRYKREKVIGVITSPYAPIVYDQTGQYVFTAALDKICKWNIRQQKLEREYFDSVREANITALAISNERIAAGYADGWICVFNIKDGTIELSSQGHSTAVSVLCFNEDGSNFASGGDDTEIVMWDITSSSGLYRLRGHKGAITGLTFLNKSNALISSSRDMLIKIWELETQHCVQTLIGTRNEIWAIAKNPEETRLVVGSIDSELRVWNIEPLIPSEANVGTELHERDPIFIGSIHREHTNRVLNLKFDVTGRLLAVHGDSRILEVYRTRTEEEIANKLERNKQKRIAKLKNKDIPEEEKEEEMKKINEMKAEARHEFKKFCEMRAEHKVRSFDFNPTKIISFPTDEETDCRVIVGTLRNTIEEWKIENYKEQSRLTTISMQGHGTPVRALAISSDNILVASASNQECKIWVAETGECIKTLSCGYALCCEFLPGNKHIIVGTKSGDLELFDINSGLLLERIQAHTGAIWKICLKPDKRGIITGSSDKTVKFWDFELVLDEEYSKTARRISLSHDHTLKMNNDVLSICCSANAKFIAISLLDNTVKVFYLDSLKFFVSLYGHKLPVNTIDISDDERLIITGSADKNIKIWGLDFGDCHRSLFAHKSSVVAVQFVKKTHYFFSAGRDGAIKYWDADNFQMIQELREEAPHSPLWALAISRDGYHVIASGHERALWFYNRTEELLFTEEERERKMEQEYAKDLINSQQFKNLTEDRNAESAHFGKRTIETIKDGERLIEKLEYAMEDDQKWEEYNRAIELNLPNVEKPSVNPILLGKSTDEYVWWALTLLKRSEIDNILAIISFSHALYILQKLDKLLKTKRLDIELAARVIFSITEIFQKSITMDESLFPLMESLSKSVKKKLREERDGIGFNLAALRFVKNRMENEKQLLDINDAIRLDRHIKKKKEQEERKWKIKMKQQMLIEEIQGERQFQKYVEES